MSNMIRYFFFMGATVLLLHSQVIRSIDNIKEQYGFIHEHLSNYTKQSMELNGMSSEGAIAEIYRDGNGTVRLIKVNIFGEMGKGEEVYYFHNNKLFFFYNVATQYNASVYAESQFDPKLSKILRDRCYFINGKMDRWINNAHEKVSPASKVFREKEFNILNFVKRNFRFLLSPLSKTLVTDYSESSIEKRKKLLHWERTVGKKENSALLKVIQSHAGGYLIALKLSLPKEERTKLLFLKFGADGSLLWKYSPKKAECNSLFEFHEERDGSLLICRENETEGYASVWIDKLSVNGILLWRKEVEKAYPGVLSVLACIPMRGKGYIAAGDRTIGGIGESDFWIERLDFRGRKMWHKHYTKTPQDRTLKVETTFDDGFMVTGFRDNKDSETNVWAMKLDAFGKKVWEKYLGKPDGSARIGQ